MSCVKDERYLRIEIYALNKSKNLHSTVALIISHDYHKGKFETEAQILGMRPKVCCRPHCSSGDSCFYFS